MRVGHIYCKREIPLIGLEVDLRLMPRGRAPGHRVIGSSVNALLEDAQRQLASANKYFADYEHVERSVQQSNAIEQDVKQNYTTLNVELTELIQLLSAGEIKNLSTSQHKAIRMGLKKRTMLIK